MGMIGRVHLALRPLAPVAAAPRSTTWAARGGALRHFAQKVTFVKKIYKDGSTCQKCDFVWKQIEKDGLTEKIDRTIYLDERDPTTEGFEIAREFKITKAPFFTVTDESYKVTDKSKQVYEVYFKLKKDVFGKEAGEKEKNEEIIRDVMKGVF